ncbi:hypothetical protein [uncultured Eudoraea sp.]|uniref:hypothetical protein n=1 Tax=uncultured Eudoraea sp. TaxID=1035614 RepID=UPI0026219044|nr:hypothetical protein [uncultured Eudoraea sp.]
MAKILIMQDEKPGKVENFIREEVWDSSLLFSIHFYINDSFNALKIKGRIRYVIDSKFQENNIKIPFPQRDVHLFKK